MQFADAYKTEEEVRTAFALFRVLDGCPRVARPARRLRDPGSNVDVAALTLVHSSWPEAVAERDHSRERLADRRREHDDDVQRHGPNGATSRPLSDEAETLIEMNVDGDPDDPDAEERAAEAERLFRPTRIFDDDHGDAEAEG
jgi:hypothetical protein